MVSSSSPATEPVFVPPDDFRAEPGSLEEFAARLCREGLEAFAHNVQGAHMRLVQVGHTLVPVIISRHHQNTCSLVSFISQQVSYPLIILAGHRWLGWLARITRRPLEWAARLARLDQVAHANHWLIGGPQVRFPTPTWRAIAGLIAAEHPRHAVLVRDVIPELSPGQLQAMALAGGIAFPGRRIHLFDPAAPRGGKAMTSVRRHLNKAQNRLRAARRHLLARSPQSSDDFERLAALHYETYSRRFAINIHYKPEFFKALAALDDARYSLWDGEDGLVEAFDFVVSDGTMLTWSTSGAVPRQPMDKGYYHLAFAATLELALSRSQIANLGLGADEYKRSRGSTPAIEWDVVFVDHLPWLRRVVWRAVAGLRCWRMQTWPPAHANGPREYARLADA